MEKKRNVFFGFAVLAVTAIFTFTACPADPAGGGVGGGGSFVAVTNIVDIPRIALTNDEMELNGVVLPSNATNQTITWSGDGVEAGKFTAPTATVYNVTATVVNGASESSSYTKNFTITAYDKGNSNNNIISMQGSWTKPNSVGLGGTDTITLTGITWSLSNSEIDGMDYATGIVLSDTGTKYKCQINEVIGDLDGGGYGLRPSYFFDEGSYVLDDNTMKMESSGLSTGYTSPMSGTWTKVP